MKKQLRNILTVKELAGYVHLHPITIYNYLKRGEIPAFKIGKSWRFKKKSIDKWLFEKEKEQRQKTKK